jgi:hypothetical protein
MKRTFEAIAIIAVMTLAALVLTGCDPETAKTLWTTSLKVVNEYANSPIGAVSVFADPGGNGDRIWTGPSGLEIPYGSSRVFNDVPEGTWSVFVAGETIDNVVFSYGMTTTVTRTSAGKLIVNY